MKTLTPHKKRWAPRTRTGCQTCRERKVKCDETKPVCDRCAISNGLCKGYLTATGLVAQRSVAQPMPAAPTPLLQVQSSMDIHDIIRALPRISIPMHYAGDDRRRSARVVIEQVLKYLPSRVGHSDALDAAIKCVAAGVRELCRARVSFLPVEMPTTNTDLQMQRLHIKALSTLRRALADPYESLTIETATATHLLSFFESFKDSDFNTVKKHMTGVAQVVEHRGPSHFSSTCSFETDFNTYSAMMIGAICYFNNTPCFLGAERWQRVLQRNNSVGEKHFFHSLRATLCGDHAVAECTALIRSLHRGEEVSSFKYLSLQRRLFAQRREFTGYSRLFMKEALGINSVTDIVGLVEEAKRDIKRPVQPMHQAVLSVNLWQNVLIINLRLQVALGGPDALAIESQAQYLARQMDTVHTKFESDAEFPKRMALINSVLSTADEWRVFAASVGNKPSARPLDLVSEDVFLRWIKLAGVDIQT